MNLSRNFTLEEMNKSSTAQKYNIKNIPDADSLSNMKRLCEDILQPIRDEWKQPIIVTSGYRCPPLNKKVKGAVNSDHMYGAAADIKTDSKQNNKLLWRTIMKLIEKDKIRCRQIIDEYDFSWIHISINHNKNHYKLNQILHQR